MEIDLTLSVRARDEVQQVFLVSMLADGPDRPLDEDDLPAEQQPWFEPLDELEPAEWASAVAPDRVHAEYLLNGLSWEETLEDLLAALANIGVRDVYALMADDEGGFGLWVQQQGDTRACHQWQGQSLEALFEGEEDRAAVLDRLRASA